MGKGCIHKAGGREEECSGSTRVDCDEGSGQEQAELAGQDGQTPGGLGRHAGLPDTTQPAAEVGWPRATARGMAQSDPGEGTRVGSQGPAWDLTARGPPSTGEVPRHHPGGRTGAPTLRGKLGHISPKPALTVFALSMSDVS